MAANIGTLSAKVTADISDFSVKLGRARREAIEAKTAISAPTGLGGFLPDFGAMKADFLGGLKGLAAPAIGGLAGAGSFAGLVGIFQSLASHYKELNREASRMRMSVEALQELEEVAEKTGVEVTDLTHAMDKMSKFVSEAAKGDEAAIKTLKELGFTAQYLRNMSPDKMFEEMARQLLKVENQTDRTRLEMEMFGKSGAQIANALKMSAEGLSQFSDRVLTAHDVETLAKANQELHEMGEMLKLGVAEGFAIATEDVKEFMKSFGGEGTMRGNSERLKGILAGLVIPGGLGIGPMMDQFGLADSLEKGYKLDY